MAGRTEWTAKHLFPHHRQEHDLACAAACLRMVAEWITGAPQSEYRWRLAAKMGPRGVHLRDFASALGQLCALAPPATSWRALPVESWRRALERRPRLAADTVDLVYVDSHDPDGANLHHWMVLLDLSREASGNTDHLVALLADPLAETLRSEAWRSLLNARVHLVHRVRRGPGFPRLVDSIDPARGEVTERSPRRATGRRPTSRASR